MPRCSCHGLPKSKKAQVPGAGGISPVAAAVARQWDTRIENVGVDF